MNSFHSSPSNSRDYLFDNLKAVMLFLVAAGHILDPFIIRQDSLYRYIMQYIYLFHMPVFAFITGYFSKNTEKSRDTAVKKVLLPYLFWQGLYILAALLFMKLGLADYNTDVFKPSFLLPSSPLYYLLCVFIWKVFIKDIDGLRHPLLFSFIGGLAVSLVFDKAFHIGWGACFSLLIFFVFGFKCKPEQIEKLRMLPKALSIFILAAAVIPSVALPYSFRNVRFTYEDVGLSGLTGIFYRALFYGIALLMILALINLCPRKQYFFSRIGRNAILVYAGSSFASPSLYLVLARFIPVTTYMWSNLLAIGIFSLILVYFCSMDWMKDIYDFLMSHILRIVFKNPE